MLHIEPMVGFDGYCLNRPETAVPGVVGEVATFVHGGEENGSAGELGGFAVVRETDKVGVFGDERFKLGDVGLPERRIHFPELDHPVGHGLVD